MGYVKKAAAVVGAGLVLAAALPTFATAAEKVQEVLIRNTDAEPVPTKAVGTTAVTGTVGIDGAVSVSGAVSVPDGVAINGTPTVNVAGGSVAVAPPERFTAQLDATGAIGGERCTDLVVPEGRRLVVEAVHLDVSTAATDPSVYLRVINDHGGGSRSLLRFTTPLTQRGPAFGSVRILSGRLEGPFVAQSFADGRSLILALCVGDADTSARGVVVGVSEPAA